jgi:macrolide-specific efflux system membrane fusion protein
MKAFRAFSQLPDRHVVQASRRFRTAPRVRLEEAEMSRLRARPALWINIGLAAALVVTAAVAIVVLRSSPGAAAAAPRTTPVRTGTVTATVSGSGNVTSADAVAASFVSGGTVTAITVKPGQKVAKGQVLATIAPSSAQRSLDTAQT